MFHNNVLVNSGFFKLLLLNSFLWSAALNLKAKNGLKLTISIFTIAQT